MNTLNFTFNFNAPVGQNIAHVDKLEAHFDKDMTMQVIDAKEPPVMPAAPSPRADAKGASVATATRYDSVACDERNFSSSEERALAPLGLSAPRSAAEQFLDGERLPLPEVLLTEKARELHVRLCEAGIIDEAWQPVGLSFTEKGTLIDYVAERLDIRTKWKFFGALWHVDSETLRTSKARGLDQDKTWAFRSRLDALSV